jgi:hypothetical protein
MKSQISNTKFQTVLNLLFPAACYRVPISVILACPESFFKKDSRQAGMTEKKDSTFRI